jgi:hypothetical protein
MFSAPGHATVAPTHYEVRQLTVANVDRDPLAYHPPTASQVNSLAITPTEQVGPLFAHLKTGFKRDRKRGRRVELEKQVSDLKKELESIAAQQLTKQHEQQRHKMLNANPLCSECGCEMTIRRKQRNTARLVDGKLICETCIQWQQPTKDVTRVNGGAKCMR